MGEQSGIGILFACHGLAVAVVQLCAHALSGRGHDVLPAVGRLALPQSPRASAVRHNRILAAITRDSRHKRRNTGGRREVHKKKRKFETGRPPAMTKLGEKRVHLVRSRGGNTKFRAIRLNEGNFSWGSCGESSAPRSLQPFACLQRLSCPVFSREELN
jgi:hypothetical protein